jgi:hypothetical protein
MRLTCEGLRAADFSGFMVLAALSDAEVPQEAGVYVVLRPAAARPIFLPQSIGGWFKGKDPSVDTASLQRKWVDGAEVLYIGKADARKNGGGLGQRIREYRHFGAGEPVGHWGGRYIWQLVDSAELLIAWRVSSADESPSAIEAAMIDDFHEEYRVLPFANLRRGRRLATALLSVHDSAHGGESYELA